MPFSSRIVFLSGEEKPLKLDAFGLAKWTMIKTTLASVGFFTDLETLTDWRVTGCYLSPPESDCLIVRLSFLTASPLPLRGVLIGCSALEGRFDWLSFSVRRSDWWRPGRRALCSSGWRRKLEKKQVSPLLVMMAGIWFTRCLIGLTISRFSVAFKHHFVANHRLSIFWKYSIYKMLNTVVTQRWCLLFPFLKYLETYL